MGNPDHWRLPIGDCRLNSILSRCNVIVRLSIDNRQSAIGNALQALD